MLIESCFFNVKIMYCKDITIPLKKNNPTSCLLEMSKHVSNFININIKIWTELLYRARYYTYYIKLKWRYSALLTWKISNLKKKKSDQLCLYVFIHNWSILLTPSWLIQSNKGSNVQSWPHVNFHEHFMFVVLTI